MLICSHLIISFSPLLAVTDVDVPDGLFRWGTSEDSNVLATWHFYGQYFFKGKTRPIDDLLV